MKRHVIRAVILLAHGSRDPGWRRPIERLARLLRRNRKIHFSVAYLESTAPDLETQVARLAARGYRSQTIVPVFLGSGRHLKRDLARKTGALENRHKGLRITVQRAIGERREVIDALAAVIAKFAVQ